MSDVVERQATPSADLALHKPSDLATTQAGADADAMRRAMKHLASEVLAGISAVVPERECVG